MKERKRKKIPRKPPDKKRGVGIRTLLPDDLAKRLRERAERENRTASTMIMIAVEEYLRKG